MEEIETMQGTEENFFLNIIKSFTYITEDIPLMKLE